MTHVRPVVLAAAMSALLAGCVATQPAPVTERTGPSVFRPAPARAGDVRNETYTVKRSDTLYSIALDNGLDYKDLAEWNGIGNPGAIQTGQVLRMRAPESPVQVNPVRAPGAVEARPLGIQAPDDGVKSEPRAGKLPYSEENIALLLRGDARPQPKPEPKIEPGPPPVPQAKPQADDNDEDKVDWSWPAAGKIIAGFSESTNKGVDIAGKMGDPVYATAGGKVVYSGTGLRGYGKLIIIKHNNSYLSAYAHNRELLVKENQIVVKGQRIAEIGNTDADQAKLHFEIRHLGKPVDPLRFLPDRPS